jgi:aminoglycoside phosphotransferase (APT) family kinase protein
MAYEKEIIHAEVAYYEAAEPTGWVPVPRLVHVDLTRTVIDSDFLLMTYLPGQGWHGDVDVDRPRLRGDLGRMVATLHQVTGSAFGYPRGPEVGLAPSWSAAFTAMFDTVCADARRFGVELPVPVAELEALVRSRQALLDEVTTPVLVHFDLWDGNILVDRGEVTGLIDGERAFWGDPVAEFVSLALLGDIEQDPAFLAGYREIAGPLEFDERVRARLSLYRCYLYLIMLVESGPRRFAPAQLHWLRDVVTPCLTTEIEAVRHGPR